VIKNRIGAIIVDASISVHKELALERVAEGHEVFTKARLTSVCRQMKVLDALVAAQHWQRCPPSPRKINSENDLNCVIIIRVFQHQAIPILSHAGSALISNGTD
jgi:hypothetical protein